MTMKSARLARRAERAELRRGPPWKWPDALVAGVMTLVMLYALFNPALLADIGDTVVGSPTIDPTLGTSPSGLLLMLARWGLALTVLAVVINVREAPLQQRIAWAMIGVALLLNYSRNIYTGNPATASFLLAHVGLAWLLWRLTARPTVWVERDEYRQRAEAAEAELSKLREGM